MALCMELNLWSSRSIPNVQARGFPWSLVDWFSESSRDTLKELEELLQSNSCMCTKWRTQHCCQMLLSCGILVTLSLSGLQLERVVIDRALMRLLPANDTISHAVFGECFLLLTLADDSRVWQVYLGRWSQSSPEKLSAADIKVSSKELPGGGGHPTSTRVALSRAQDVGVCWWKGGHGEESERASLVLLGFSESPGLVVLSSIRTGGKTLDCCFSLTQPYQILTVEQLKKDPNSTIGMQEEAHVIQTCVYECVRGRLRHLSDTTLSSVPVSWCRDPSERWLLLGFQDFSLVLVHIETGLQTRFTCSMRPSVLVWHPDGGLIVVAGEQGELQCFDLGLSPLELKLIFKEVERSFGRSLQLARYPEISSELKGLEWAHSTVSQVADWSEVHDLLMLRFQGGLLGAMKLRLGELNGAQLGALQLLQHRVGCGEVDAALCILRNMDWCMMGEDCYHGLVSVTDHLLRKPLNEQTEAQLEDALGTFCNPSRDLTDRVILLFYFPITLIARKFFHRLLNHQRFENALSLAEELCAWDLLKELYEVAQNCGETSLAQKALQKADLLEAAQPSGSKPTEQPNTSEEERNKGVGDEKTDNLGYPFKRHC